MPDPALPPTPTPPAAGVRLAWSKLPAALRAAIEARAGAPVLAAVSQPGGFSPGLASRVRLADGRRLFLKAVHPSGNPVAPSLHRREAAIVGALPADVPVPSLQWMLDEGPDGWVVLAFDDVAGRQPPLPWQPDVLDRVLGAMTSLVGRLTPSPVAAPLVRPASEAFDPVGAGWASLADAVPDRLDPWSRRHLDRLIRLEAGIADAARGTSLQHQDLRADNVLLTDEAVWIVDWPHAALGPPWLDLVWFAPSVAMQGGPDPEALWRGYRPAALAEPEAADVVIAAVAGFFSVGALQPDPPGLPTVRAFQEAQGAVARRWLADRRGWR
jgi:aminoglycoside phosphotransferase (APT) family kinase protein